MHIRLPHGQRFRMASAMVLILAAVACGGTGIFSAPGTNLANPLTVAVDSATARAYIVNSNNKVLYTEGSLHVVNIATPANPTRVGSVALSSFSGKIFVDTAAQLAYIPNRLSDNVDDLVDSLVRVDLNEAGAFLTTTAIDADQDPFGTARYAATNQLLVTSGVGRLDSYNLNSATLSPQGISLKRSLSDGGAIQQAAVADIIVIGSQAVISRAEGGLLVVNVDELGNSSANPVDYFISDLGGPRGLATDGTLVYVANVELVDEVEQPSLLTLNVAALTPDATSSTTTVRDKDTDGLLVATLTVGSNPQQVVAGTGQVYVSNLGADTVTVMNRATREKITDIAVGDEPFGMALYSPGGVDTALLVCNVQSNSVSIIDLPSLSVVATYK